MANAIKYSALGSIVTAIPGNTTAPTLKNLSSAARKLGDEIDWTQTGERWQEANAQLKVRGASAFTSGGYVDLYLVKKLNGNYNYGSDSLTPPATDFAGRFFLDSVSTQQYITIQIVLPNCPFKPFLINNGGQAFTNTNDENELRIEPYDFNEVQ